MKFFAHSNGHDFELDIQPERDKLLITCNGKQIVLALDEAKWSIRTAFIGDRRLDFGWDRSDGVYNLHIEGIEYEVVVRDPKTESLAKVVGEGPAASQTAEVKAPIPGLITKVLLKAGDVVKKDQPVLCLDAMKLENEISAPRDGTLKSIEVQPGQAVEKGQSLFVVG
ncbi:MAG TPA: acetyl-CoA carboxylase biotin carboxyl carrier protein subunit [Planctomycetota bacterium]|nr:acetyl-CoA carboxylase biotin carboxyl carrier protein subunit [Planctomycetota bacterium]